jgi:uncharacterized protein (DUF924 family)
MEANDILNFWFEEIDKKLWFSKDSDFDRLVKESFLPIYNEIINLKKADWRQTAEGRLAEIIVLDQFSRNMFRDLPQSFATDAMALSLAQEAVHLGFDQKLLIPQRIFLYMPYMHSEDAQVHAVAVKLFSQKGLEENLRFELAHKEIIDRFGRYPHRNKILDRISSREEIEFMKQPGSSF